MSRNKMRGMLKNSIRLQSETSLHLWKTWEDSGDISRAWDNIRVNIRISAQESVGYCESKHGKPWFDEEYSKSSDRRKQSKLQWLQDPSEANEDNLSGCKVGS
jgi:hypothetical protein